MAKYLPMVLLAFLAALSGTPAWAQDAIIGITMAGEAYDGRPKFRLLADGHEIGARDIAQAIDTVRGNKLKFGADSPSPASERFLFKVADIQDVSRLDVEFINDAQATGRGPGDRNIYLLSLSVSMVTNTPTGSIITIHQLLPTAFKPQTTVPDGAGISPTHAALYHKGSLRLQRPAEGWGNKPVEKPADGKASEEIASAKSSTPPEEAPPCTPSFIEIDGFAKNSTSISTEMRPAFENLARSFGDSTCTVKVTALAAGGPSQKFRDQLSLARAEAVIRELARLGLASDKIHAEGATGRGRHVLISFE